MAPHQLTIDDLPEQVLCVILGNVDFASKQAVLRCCRKWYRLLTYPPQSSGVWGTLPLNLMRLHDSVRTANLDWLARRAAGVSALSIYAGTPRHPPRCMSTLQTGQGRFQPGAPREDEPGGGEADSIPYRLAPGRHFADFSLARILGMLSPWLQHVRIHLSGSTFEHRSYPVLADSAQPWLTAALTELRFESNMVGAEDKFPQLCGFTSLTRLECTAVPAMALARTPCILTVPPGLSQLQRLRILKLDLRADSQGLPASASALGALRQLDLRAGAKLDPDVLLHLSRLEDLALSLGKRQPRAPPARVDEERLARALAPLTRLTSLQLTACGLGSIPTEVLGMRRLVDLNVSGNELWRCGKPPPPSSSPPDAPAGNAAAGPAGPGNAGGNAGGNVGNDVAGGAAVADAAGANVAAADAAAAGNAAGGGIAAAGNAAGGQPHMQVLVPGLGGPVPMLPPPLPPPGAPPDIVGGGVGGLEQHELDMYEALHAAHAAVAGEARLASGGGGWPGGAAAAKAPTGHKWWPPGLARALTGLTKLTVARCGIKALPPDLAALSALVELHLPHNLLGGDGKEPPLPALPKLEVLDLSFNGYKVLPPGLLQQSALTRLRFLDVPARVLPPLKPLLQLPNLQQAVLMKEDSLMRHRAQTTSSTANIIRLGAFEAKFVALRQARAAEQPAPAGDAVMPRFGTPQTPFTRLNAVEEAGSHQDIHGQYGIHSYPDDFYLGPPYAHHMNVYDPPDDEDEEHDEEDEDEMEWADEAGWHDHELGQPWFGGLGMP